MLFQGESGQHACTHPSIPHNHAKITCVYANPLFVSKDDIVWRIFFERVIIGAAPWVEKEGQILVDE